MLFMMGQNVKDLANTFLVIAGHHRSLALRYLKQEWLGVVAQCANLSPLRMGHVTSRHPSWWVQAKLPSILI